MALTDFQWALIFAILAFLIGIVIVLLFWISRKYPSKNSKSMQNPFISVLIFIGLALIIAIGLVAFGLVEKESLKKNLKWFLIGGVLLLIIFIIYAYFHKRPIPTYDLFHKYLLPEAKQLLGGELYVGYAYLDGFMWSMVIPSQLSEYMRDQGIFNEKVEVFFFQMKHSNIFSVIGIRDKFTGEGLMLHKNPSVSLLNRYLGREVTKSMTEQLGEYNKNQDEAQNDA